MRAQLKDSYPVERPCGVLDCPRSSYDYPTGRREAGAIVEAVEPLWWRRPCFGDRRMAAQLRREGRTVNTKVVRSILKALGVQRKMRQVRVRTPDSRQAHWRYPNLSQGWQPIRPDYLWAAAVTSIRLGSRFSCLAVSLDAYSRAVRGWSLRRALSKPLTLDALCMALQHGAPPIHHADQGVQYTAFDSTDRLLMNQVRMRMADTGEPTQNGLAERFMPTIKEALVDDALAQISTLA